MSSAPSLIEFVDDDSSVDSLSSTGNATYLSSLENYQTEVEQPRYNYHGPKIVLPPNESPVTICTTDTINMVKSRRLLRVLLDSGSTVSLIKRTALPPNVVTKEISTTRHVTTLAGKIQAQEVVTLRDLRLPEFDKNRRIGEQKCLVFDNDNVKYDIILGTNFLAKAGIKLNYSEGKMEWFDCSIPLRPPGGLTSDDFDAMEDMFFIQAEDELLGEDWLRCYAAEILDAKYKWTDVSDVVDNLTHLNLHQKADLLKVLKENDKMFDGTLGTYPHRKVHIDLLPDAKPVHLRPYPVPRVHLKTFKTELDHLVELGVSAPTPESEWASPSFIVPKKDGGVRWISDLRQLNKVIQ